MDWSIHESRARNFGFRTYTETLVEALCEHPVYNWVGFYWVVGDVLQLGAWRGPAATEHVSIPVGQGICGAAVTERATIIVDDVTKDSRYLQCFLGTKSEIVVPIHIGGDTTAAVIGEIDIDSDLVGGFTPKDREELEALAKKIGEMYPADYDPRSDGHSK